MKKSRNAGFTLIELVIVVAILAMIATVAIGKFKDVRETAAKRTHLASIVNVQHTIETEIANSDSISGMFNYCDSLVSMGSRSTPATGTAGQYVWATTNNNYFAQENTYGGIYAGQVVPMAVTDATGQGSGVTPTFASIQENNSGIPLSLRKMLGVYYLTDSERTALHKAGVGILSYHNPSSAQAQSMMRGRQKVEGFYDVTTGYSPDDLKTRGGGPGFRPEASAFFPVYMDNSDHPHAGLGVAVLDPSQAGAVYRAFVTSKAYPDDKATLDGLKSAKPEDWFSTSGLNLPRLVVIGLGKNSDTVNKFFSACPRDNTLSKHDYWNYCLVFQLNNGGRGGSDAKFVGVIDSRGNTPNGVENNMDWN